MKNFLPVRSLLSGLLFLGLGLALVVPARAGRDLVDNADFEDDRNRDGWPDGWGKPATGGAMEEENHNHFLRLKSSSPGEMVMMYQEVPLPKGTKALEISWRQRITGLKIGKESWFDIRIMMEFLDAEKNKIGPGPKVPTFRKDVPEWTEVMLRFPVPEGAVTLKFMPALFQVAAGTWDIDDLVIKPILPDKLNETPSKTGG